MSKILHPWSVEPTSLNHYYMVVVHDGAMSRIIAQRVKKSDAERIVRSVNEHADIVQRANNAEIRVRELEETVRRLRAFLRDNEVRTLRGMQLVEHEAI